MAELTLYLDLMSQPCRSVYIFAKANAVPFITNDMRLFKGDHLSADFFKVNPLRKVPALKDGDFTMAESTAILIYLVNKYKTPDHWYPSDIKKRARVDEYLAWQQSNTRPLGSKLFWIKAMTPYILGHEATADKLDSAVAEFNKTLKNIEDYFLQDKPFLVGDEISVADLVAIVEIMQPVGAGIDVFEGKPKLSAWKQRVQEAVGVELFKEAHERILHAKDMQNQPIPPELEEVLKAKLRYFSS